MYCNQGAVRWSISRCSQYYSTEEVSYSREKEENDDWEGHSSLGRKPQTFPSQFLSLLRGGGRREEKELGRERKGTKREGEGLERERERRGRVGRREKEAAKKGLLQEIESTCSHHFPPEVSEMDTLATGHTSLTQN